jgi:hypothetical protein
MLWILSLPALAVIVMLAYVLGYRAGRKAADRAARLREEEIRERRYCGTARAHMEELKVVDEIRQLERMYDDV